MQRLHSSTMTRKGCNIHPNKASDKCRKCKQLYTTTNTSTNNKNTVNPYHNKGPIIYNLSNDDNSIVKATSFQNPFSNDKSSNMSTSITKSPQNPSQLSMTNPTLQQTNTSNTKIFHTIENYSTFYKSISNTHTHTSSQHRQRNPQHQSQQQPNLSHPPIKSIKQLLTFVSTEQIRLHAYVNTSTDNHVTEFICVFYRLLQLRPTTKQLEIMLKHNNPNIRVLGLMYIRYAIRFEYLWYWMGVWDHGEIKTVMVEEKEQKQDGQKLQQEHNENAQEAQQNEQQQMQIQQQNKKSHHGKSHKKYTCLEDNKLINAEMTVGELAQKLLDESTGMQFAGVRMPRIPTKIQKDITQRLHEWKQEKTKRELEEDRIFRENVERQRQIQIQQQEKRQLLILEEQRQQMKRQSQKRSRSRQRRGHKEGRSQSGSSSSSCSISKSSSSSSSYSSSSSSSDSQESAKRHQQIKKSIHTPKSNNRDHSAPPQQNLKFIRERIKQKMQAEQSQKHKKNLLLEKYAAEEKMHIGGKGDNIDAEQLQEGQQSDSIERHEL